MPDNPRGWRRLWPSTLWLRTIELSPGGFWQWEIWSADKTKKLACGAEEYTRAATAARGGVRFGKMNMTILEERG